MTTEINYEYKTGVLSSNNVNWEFMDDGICIICEDNHKEIVEQIESLEIQMNHEKEKEIPDYEKIEGWAVEIEDLEEELEFFYCEDHEKLLGSWLVDEEGLYYPDVNGEFAGIQLDSTFNCIQVVWSRTIAHNRRATSPCFPNQVDIDSAGNLSCYTLPDYLIYNPEEN